MFSFTDGENHWRASIRRIRGQSCYDQWCCFTAPQASDRRGKGAVDFTGAQLDFTLVCVFVVRVCKSLRVCCYNGILLPSFPAHTLACPFLHTHLPSWMGGSLRPMTQLASLWTIPSSCSTNKMLSGRVGRHKLYRTKLNRHWRVLVTARTRCKSGDIEKSVTTRCNYVYSWSDTPSQILNACN